MKKLFFMAALSVAGLMSANDLVQYPVKKASSEKKEVTIFRWDSTQKQFIRVTVETTCGETWSQVLWFDQTRTENDFIGIANAINIIKCDEKAEGWEIIP